MIDSAYIHTGEIWVSSDWHCDPLNLKHMPREWITAGVKCNAMLVGNGDLFNILPWGRDKWKHALAISQFIKILDGYDFWYICGNHDPYKDIIKMMKGHRNIHVVKKLDINRYHIEHGHLWALDWRIINNIAPHFVEAMVDICPGIWYKYCKARGWLANSLSSSHHEQQKINRLAEIIWMNATKYALSHNKCVICGHTHTSSIHNKGVGMNIHQDTYLLDEGDLNDGSYCVANTNGVELSWM